MRKLTVFLFIVGLSFVPSVALTADSPIQAVETTATTPYEPLHAATSTIKPIEIQEPIEFPSEEEISQRPEYQDDTTTPEPITEQDAPQINELEALQDSLEHLHEQHSEDYDLLVGYIEDIQSQIYELQNQN